PSAAGARAAALGALGRYAEAADAAAAAGEAALEARYAWLAGNWRAAAAAGDADRRILAAWMAGDGAMPAELQAAAADDPTLDAWLDAFSRAEVESRENMVDAATEALDAARRRRAVMGELLSDG
ncbi:MAG: hypothetical protein EA355_11795, partial [Rhodobacteraceae bacterium]